MNHFFIWMTEQLHIIIKAREYEWMTNLIWYLCSNIINIQTKFTLNLIKIFN